MLLRLFETIHGHFGVLAAAALVHPALLLRKGAPLTRGKSWSLALSALLTVLTFGSGTLIYPSYTRIVKRELFYASTRAGLLFETKEHLAFAVLCLTLGALLAAVAAPRAATELRRAAALLFALAAALCLLSAGLGSYVASLRGF